MPDKNYWRFKTYLDLGKKFMEPIWKECDFCRNLLESPPEKDKIKVRILKRLAQMFTDKIFPRDPEVTAKAKRPMPGPIQIDPETGMPAVDPMTGDFLPPEDLSEKRAEVVEGVMNVELKILGFQGEVRAAIHDAFCYPVGVTQNGYDFDETRDIDSAYSRRRSIKDVIVDPHIQMYFGQIHDCRFMGVRLKLTREDCKRRKIDFEKIPQEDQSEEGEEILFQMPSQQNEPTTDGEDYSKSCTRYHVWQIWDISKRDYSYISEKCSENIFKPKPWPWKLKTGFPIKILSMDRIPDKPFGHSLVWDLQDQQQEVNDLRTTMHDQVVDAKPFTVFDPMLLDEDKISNIANRRRDLHVPVDGLGGKMIEQFFRKINPDGMTPQELEFYNVLKQELQDVGAASSNDRFEATNATATEAAIIEKASALLAGAKSASTIIFMRQNIQCLHEIIEQTYETERVTQITSPEQGKLWVAWTGPNLLGDFDTDLDIITAEPNDPETERNKAMGLKKVFQGDQGINQEELNRDVLKAFGKKKPERYIVKMPPIIPGIPGGIPPGIIPPGQGGKK